MTDPDPNTEMPAGSPQEAVVRALERAIDDEIMSAAQVEFGLVDHPVFSTALGTCAFDGYDGADETVDETTRFDVASLTKAICTSVIVMRAVQSERLELDARLASLLAPGLLHPTIRGVSVQDLLRHRSGLPWWRPFFDDVPPHLHGSEQALEQIRRAVAGLQAQSSPAYEYSDPNYILLDWALQWHLGGGLDALFEAHVVEPLGLEHSGFVDLKRGAQPLEPAVATEVVDWRDGLVRGVAHDGNCYAMGGVSGHAGLFSTACDIGRVARALLAADAESEDADAWIESGVLRRFWDRRWLRGDGDAAPGTHVLGWDTPSGERSSAGDLITRDQAVGHLGFTGGSLWLDRARGAYGVLLTNRVHPSRDDVRHTSLRPRIHDFGWQIVDAASA